MGRHTTGDWRSHDTDEGEWVVDIPNDGEITVTRLYFGDMETNTGRDIANANLVAASPDLLEACQAAYDWLTEGHEPQDALDQQLHDAIAKASGVRS